MNAADLDLDKLRARVRALRGRYAELSAAAGVSGSWLSKFGRGRYWSPRLATVVRLSAALDAVEQPADRTSRERAA
jgi:predicted transcriptional regulator